MKEKIFLMAGLFLCCQSHGASGNMDIPRSKYMASIEASTFLDGLDSQVTAETFMFYVAPFSTGFIGKKSGDAASAVVGIGESATGLAMIDAGEISAEHRPILEAEKHKRITQLANPKTFPVTIAGALETRSWHAHTVSATDIKIAKALYGVVNTAWAGYYQVEEAVWNVLPSIVGISKAPAGMDPKSLAAMDLWTFLTAMTVGVWPCNPLPPRLSKPPYASGAEPCKDMAFLATTFKRLIEAYEMVKFA